MPWFLTGIIWKPDMLAKQGFSEYSYVFVTIKSEEMRFPHFPAVTLLFSWMWQLAAILHSHSSRWKLISWKCINWELTSRKLTHWKLIHLEHAWSKNGSTWPAFLWQNFLSKSLWESKSFKISYQRVQMIDILLNTSFFKRFKCSKWFWQKILSQKSR